MQRVVLLLLALMSIASSALEIPLQELADGKVHKYYLQGGVPIVVFQKNDAEQKLYANSLVPKYLPFTEYSRVFGNQMASSLYQQQVVERRDANNAATKFGVFITYLPTTDCYFTVQPVQHNARVKDDCSGVEYDGNGKALDARVLSYLATPTFHVQNDKLIVEISNVASIRQLDFTPSRLVDRKFVKGIARINNAFSWHRFDLVLEEMALAPSLIETPEFAALIAHIMLNAGATEQLTIISKAIGYGFDLNEPIKQHGNEWFSATELGVASLNPFTLTFLATHAATTKSCLDADRFATIKQLSKDRNKYFEEQDFENKLADYLKRQSAEYCWVKTQPHEPRQRVPEPL